MSTFQARLVWIHWLERQFFRVLRDRTVLLGDLIHVLILADFDDAVK
jgi:hypothetical protein